MRILLVMDPGILVPPKGYGGHERLVEMFAKQYLKMGHQVHLLVTKGSQVEGCTVFSLGKEGFPPKKFNALLAILKAWYFLFKNRNKYDVIHNFGRLAYLLPILNLSINKIMTYGRAIDKKNILIINKLPFKNIFFTGCSQHLINEVKEIGNWKPIFNAIDFEKYKLVNHLSEEAPLIFLGRIEKIKGCHIAIQVAKATNQRLIIAGNISPLIEEQLYFKNEIEPYIDGLQIQYVGSVNDIEKNSLLGSAKALLFPINWEEPFGMVMVEAMACGTPVIAFNRGSVPEVIDQNISGIIVHDVNQMINAVNLIHLFDRQNCRMNSYKKFDVSIIANEYLNSFF